MDLGIWRKSGRRTVHLERLHDQKGFEEDAVFKYSPSENGNNYAGSPKQPRWKVIWKNLLKPKKKKTFVPSVLMHVKAPYNSETYMQNFDRAQTGQTIDEYLDDFLPRSFTARYADPSKLLS